MINLREHRSWTTILSSKRGIQRKNLHSFHPGQVFVALALWLLLHGQLGFRSWPGGTGATLWPTSVHPHYLRQAVRSSKKTREGWSSDLTAVGVIGRLRERGDGRTDPTLSLFPGLDLQVLANMATQPAEMKSL